MNNEINAVISNRPNDVASMTGKIKAALKSRAEFEQAKSPNGSHIELQRTINALYGINGIPRVSAFLVICNADPDLMLNRVRKDGSRANLKGFQKVRKLIDYLTGKSGNFETVSKALFCSTIVAALKGVTWVASPEQEYILSPERINSFPKDVRLAVSEYQHRYMSLTGDSRPQACQFRTTFENLGMFDTMRDDFDNNAYTMGIVVNLDHPVIVELINRWALEG